MRAWQLISLLVLISSYGFVNAIDRIQLSPRLLYSREDGNSSLYGSRTNAVIWARQLLDKLGLTHLKSKLVQAKIVEFTNELLFEMETYLYALEVKRMWDEKLEEIQYDEEADRKSMDCASDCVNKDYKLEQTEKKFW
ncbi:hypothetical protein KR215_001179, partial [Drosophila sulfurigaster]